MTELLKKKERRVIQKDWGWIDWIYNGEFCGKIIYMKKDRHNSWHYHNLTDEVAYVEDGEVELTYGLRDDGADAVTKTLKSGEAFHISKGTRHQFKSKGVTIYEFSLSMPDSDIVRLTKDLIRK